MDLLNLHVSLVCLVTGRELGWDEVVALEVNVGGVVKDAWSLRMFRRVVEVENAVVAVVVFIVVVVAVANVIVTDAIDTGDAVVDVAVSVAVAVVVDCNIDVGVI